MKKKHIDFIRCFYFIIYAVIIVISVLAGWIFLTNIIRIFLLEYLERNLPILTILAGVLLWPFLLSIIVFWIIFVIGKSKFSRTSLLIFVILTLGTLVGYKLIFTSILADIRYQKLDEGLYSFSPGNECKYYLGENAGEDCRIGDDGFRTCPFSNSERGPLIVLIGDSFVYGWRLPDKDTLCASLGNELRNRNFGDVRIKNLGIPALNFVTYAKMADYASKTNPDWIFVEYLAQNDTAYSDMFSYMSGLQKTSLTKFFSVIFDKQVAWKLTQLYNQITTNLPPSKITFSRFRDSVNILDKLSRKTNIVILSYEGDNEFTHYLKMNIKNLDVIDLTLKESVEGEYFMINDSHPNAKANQKYAIRIADYIVAKKKLNPTTKNR